MNSFKQLYLDNKNMYSVLRNGSYRLGRVKLAQTGGFASITSDMMDVLLGKFNILNHIDIISNFKINEFTNIDYEIRKIFEISNIYLDNNKQQSLAKIIRDKKSKITVKDFSILNEILNNIMKNQPENKVIFENVQNYCTGKYKLTINEKLDLIKNVAYIVGENVFWKELKRVVITPDSNYDIDILLKKFNVLGHLSFFNNFSNIDEYKDNKIFQEISNTYLSKSEYNYLSKKLKTTPIDAVGVTILINKIKRSLNLIKNLDDSHVLETIERLCNDMSRVVIHLPQNQYTITDEKEPDTRLTKTELLQRVKIIAGDEIYRRAIDEIAKTISETIFGYYAPDIIKYTDPNILIFDNTGYALYTKGYINVDNIANIKFYKFDRDEFKSINVDKEMDKYKYVKNASLTYYHDLTKSISMTSFNIEDIIPFYDLYKEVLDSLISFGSDFLPIDINSESINPGITNFMEKIYSIRNNYGNITGKFSKRNDLIYTFILSDTCDIFMKMLVDVLKNTTLDLETNIIVNMTDLNNGVLYNTLQNENRLEINKYLYIKFKKKLSQIIKSYNYVKLTKKSGIFDEMYLSTSPKQMVEIFFKELYDFMISAIEFKKVLTSYILMDDKLTKAPDIIIFAIISYIIYVIRFSTNIDFNKAQLIDKLTDITRNDSDLIIHINTQYPSPQQKDFSTWMYTKQLQTRNEFIPIKEYDITSGTNKYNSCGESLTLNLMNYALIGKGGKFDMRRLPSQSNDKMFTFYKNFPTLRHQLLNQLDTLKNWVTVIENIDGVKYNNNDHELIPSYDNVTNLFKILIGMKGNEKKKYDTLYGIILSIDKNINIYVKESPQKKELIFDSVYVADFTDLHGSMSYVKNEYSCRDDMKYMKQVCLSISNLPKNRLMKLLINRCFKLCNDDIKTLTCENFTNIMPYFTREPGDLVEIFKINGFNSEIHQYYITTESTDHNKIYFEALEKYIEYLKSIERIDDIMLENLLKFIMNLLKGNKTVKVDMVKESLISVCKNSPNMLTICNKIFSEYNIIPNGNPHILALAEYILMIYIDDKESENIILSNAPKDIIMDINIDLLTNACDMNDNTLYENILNILFVDINKFCHFLYAIYSSLPNKSIVYEYVNKYIKDNEYFNFTKLINNMKDAYVSKCSLIYLRETKALGNKQNIKKRINKENIYNFFFYADKDFQYFESGDYGNIFGDKLTADDIIDITNNETEHSIIDSKLFSKIIEIGIKANDLAGYIKILIHYKGIKKERFAECTELICDKIKICINYADVDYNSIIDNLLNSYIDIIKNNYDRKNFDATYIYINPQPYEEVISFLNSNNQTSQYKPIIQNYAQLKLLVMKRPPDLDKIMNEIIKYVDLHWQSQMYIYIIEKAGLSAKIILHLVQNCSDDKVFKFLQSLCINTNHIIHEVTKEIESNGLIVTNIDIKVKFVNLLIGIIRYSNNLDERKNIENLIRVIIEKYEKEVVNSLLEHTSGDKIIELLNIEIINSYVNDNKFMEVKSFTRAINLINRYAVESTIAEDALKFFLNGGINSIDIVLKNEKKMDINTFLPSVNNFLNILTKTDKLNILTKTDKDGLDICNLFITLKTLCQKLDINNSIDNIDNIINIINILNNLTELSKNTICSSNHNRVEVINSVYAKVLDRTSELNIWNKTSKNKKKFLENRKNIINIYFNIIVNIHKNDLYKDMINNFIIMAYNLEIFLNHYENYAKKFFYDATVVHSEYEDEDSEDEDSEDEDSEDEDSENEDSENEDSEDEDSEDEDSKYVKRKYVKRMIAAVNILCNYIDVFYNLKNIYTTVDKPPKLKIIVPKVLEATNISITGLDNFFNGIYSNIKFDGIYSNITFDRLEYISKFITDYMKNGYSSIDYSCYDMNIHKINIKLEKIVRDRDNLR